MKIISLILCLLPMFTSCVSVSKDNSDTIVANKYFSESCSSCGTQHHYSYSWKAEDYVFLNSISNGTIYAPRSPHGPTPACDSKYSDISYKSLKKDIPRLKKSTYNSFLKKNKTIAVHNESTALVKLDKKSGGSVSLPGFSSNQKQVLICNGQFYSLYEYTEGKWKYIDGHMIWIS